MTGIRLPALRPLQPVYGRAEAYVATGLGSPLPLPPQRKAPPPTGYTGKQAKTPSAAQVRRWVRDRPRHNVGLRLAPGVLGLDVDAYPPKVGKRTLELAQERWGSLPATVRSSARTDGISGIYLYRVPLEVTWPSVMTEDLSHPGRTGHVELVHSGLRYVVCWPSLHPQGQRYWWWDSGGKLQDIPKVVDLPDLPQGWVQGLVDLGSQFPARMPTAGEDGTSVLAAGCAPASVEQHAAVVAGAVEGQRNDVLNKAAFTLGGDLAVNAEDAETALVEAGKKAGLPLRQARSSFRSGWSAGRNRPYR